MSLSSLLGKLPPYVVISVLPNGQPLCVSWLGSIAAVKITLLTKMYLFRVLPVAIPSYFCVLYRVVYTNTSGEPMFPRMIFLQSTLRCDLGVPNFLRYYHTAQLAQITLYYATTETPLWVGLEAVDLYPLSVTNLLWMTHSDCGVIVNQITPHSVIIWGWVVPSN